MLTKERDSPSLELQAIEISVAVAEGKESSPPFYTRMRRSEFRKLTERVTRNFFERCTFKRITRG